MDIPATYAIAAAASVAYMTLFFVVAQLKGDNGIVDVAWGVGFIVITIVTLAFHGDPGARALLLAGLVVAWGLRLAIHIAIRNHGRGEDFRYAKWRQDWGDSFVVRSFLRVFMLQGFFLVVVASPIIFVTADRQAIDLRWLDVIGVVVWLVGLLFEAIGDYQLMRFKRDPVNKGRVMDFGLWRYTRHPNYFGEATLWWGIFVVALSADHGYLSVIGPAILTFLLLRVSGVTMLEKKYSGDPAYAAYQRRTSSFIPLPPRN